MHLVRKLSDLRKLMNVHTVIRRFQDQANSKGTFHPFMTNRDPLYVRLNHVRRLLSERTIFRDTSPPDMRHSKIDCNTVARTERHQMGVL